MDLIETRGGAADTGVRHPWETARLAVVKKLIDSHVDLHPGSSVLDVGCGDALVLRSLAEAFPKTRFYGVDSGFTDDLLASCQRSTHANVRLFRSLDQVPVERGTPVSLVLLMDVLEHIENDGAFLSDVVARPFMGRNTSVLVTVPAFQSLFSAHDVFLRHYRRYSNRTLQKCLEQAGLRVTDIGYFFLSLLPIRFLGVLRERLLAHRTISGTGLMRHRGGPIGAALLTRILVADAAGALALRRLGITIPGLSNYAICRLSA